MLALMVGLALAMANVPNLVLGADSAAVDAIRTKDGKLHAGRILSETARGYLFFDEQTSETYVIEFGTIQDMRRAADKAPVSQPPQPPPVPPPLLIPAPQPSPIEEALRIARVAELTKEVDSLKEELDDATLAGPIVKLVGATAFTGLALGLFIAYMEGLASPNSSSSGLSGATIGCGVAAVVLWIWGGLQLRSRLNTRAQLPGEIRNREDQLRALRRPQGVARPPPGEMDRCLTRCSTKAERCVPEMTTEDFTDTATIAAQERERQRCEREESACRMVCEDVHQ